MEYVNGTQNDVKKVNNRGNLFCWLYLFNHQHIHVLIYESKNPLYLGDLEKLFIYDVRTRLKGGPKKYLNSGKQRGRR